MEYCPVCQKQVETMEVPFFDELKILACPICHCGISVDANREEAVENAVQNKYKREK